MADADEREIDQVRRTLVAKYDGTLAEDEILAAVTRAQQELESQARVDSFLPVFVRRRAEELLREQAQARGVELSHVQQVLFVDDANTGRSHVAAAIANGRGEGRIRARSGGVTPGTELRAEIEDLLRRKGHDPDELRVTPMTGSMLLASDVVVTMGLTDEEKVQMPTHGLHQVDWDDLTSLEGRDDLDQAYAEIEAQVVGLVDALLERDLASRQVDPEVERELQEVIDDLHEGRD
ncbi:low molecular weight phosphatase family protein [Serinicoccus kebangsaanensis]|uniref:arsenate-mycothiol transferase ArsC n=1 Tax=Serinicoccus kebangsaanensis TaxID=2602069 RepID=UPI00124C99FF|nr:hypothetical protein [Serinicoccus kebangsaanensis]